MIDSIYHRLSQNEKICKVSHVCSDQPTSPNSLCGHQEEAMKKRNRFVTDGIDVDQLRLVAVVVKVGQEKGVEREIGEVPDEERIGCEESESFCWQQRQNPKRQSWDEILEPKWSQLTSWIEKKDK